MYKFEKISFSSGTEPFLYESDFQLEEGSFNVILGPTMSGKTTLLRLIAGLERPTKGKITHDGRDITSHNARKRSISFVYQFFVNYPNMTVAKNIASPMRAEGLPKSKIDSEVEKIANLLRLTPYLNRYPAELSGGQQQRVAIGRALAKKSEIILLDEPFVNLDYKLREELRDELPKFFAGQSRIIVYTTTEPNEALLLPGTLFTMDCGKITAYGKTMEMFRRPPNLLTASIFSYPPVNIIRTRFEGGEFRGEGGFSYKPAGKEFKDSDYTLAVRPFCLKTGSGGQGKDIELDARVTFTELAGAESYTHVKFGEHKWIMHEHKLVNYEIAQQIKVFINPADVMIFDNAGNNLGIAHG